jgi:hypothetical protein
MNLKNVVVARLFSGEHLVGEADGSGGTGKVSLLNPKEVAIVPQPGGMVGIAFRNVCLFGKSCRERISLPESQVMVVVPNEELPKELVDEYGSEVTGIKTASPADVPDLTGGGAKTGSFVI